MQPLSAYTRLDESFDSSRIRRIFNGAKRVTTPCRRPQSKRSRPLPLCSMRNTVLPSPDKKTKSALLCNACVIGAIDRSPILPIAQCPTFIDHIRMHNHVLKPRTSGMPSASHASSPSASGSSQRPPSSTVYYCGALLSGYARRESLRRNQRRKRRSSDDRLCWLHQSDRWTDLRFGSGQTVR